MQANCKQNKKKQKNTWRQWNFQWRCSSILVTRNFVARLAVRVSEPFGHWQTRLSAGTTVHSVGSASCQPHEDATGLTAANDSSGPYPKLAGGDHGRCCVTNDRWSCQERAILHRQSMMVRSDRQWVVSRAPGVTGNRGERDPASTTSHKRGIQMSRDNPFSTHTQAHAYTHQYKRCAKTASTQGVEICTVQKYKNVILAAPRLGMHRGPWLWDREIIRRSLFNEDFDTNSSFWGENQNI